MSKATIQNTMPIKCLICGSMKQRAIFEESGIDILQCYDCRHVFSSFPANPHYDEYWGEEVAEDDHFYWNKARSRMHQDFFQKFLVGRSGRLLDMGCGLGFFVKGVSSYENWQAYGCEISPVAVRYAREKLNLQNVICGRLKDVEFPPNSFDLITIWDVLEHLRRPDPVLRHCNALLKEGGTCFIYTPNVRLQLLRARLMKLLMNMGMLYGDTCLQPRDHLHHYSISSIRNLLERNGFSNIKALHMHPIQSFSGRKSAIAREIKNICFNAAISLAIFTKGRLNLDNLFISAQK